MTGTAITRKAQRVEPSYGAVVVSSLLSAVTATGAGSTYSLQRCPASFQGVLTGITGNTDIAATVKVQVSNDASHWIDLGIITLDAVDWDNATEDATDSFVADIGAGAPYLYVRGYVYAISGSGATVSLYMGQ